MLVEGMCLYTVICQESLRLFPEVWAQQPVSYHGEKVEAGSLRGPVVLRVLLSEQKKTGKTATEDSMTIFERSRP